MDCSTGTVFIIQNAYAVHDTRLGFSYTKNPCFLLLFRLCIGNVLCCRLCRPGWKDFGKRSLAQILVVLYILAPIPSVPLGRFFLSPDRRCRQSVLKSTSFHPFDSKTWLIYLMVNVRQWWINFLP